MEFQSPIIADMYCLLKSPELIGDGGVSYTELLAEDLKEDLLVWDKDRKFHLEDLNEKRIRRLGFYAEALLCLLFEHHPRFKLYAHNHQIIEEGRTLGELDFVIEDLVQNRLIHLELACKFYIQTKPEMGLFGMVGINKNDTLGRKWEHLQNHQLQIPSSWFNGIEALGGRIPETICCLKGRMFYPDFENMPSEINPKHWKGVWIKNKETLSSSYQHVHKAAWISGTDPARNAWPDMPYNAEMLFSEKEGWAIYLGE